MTELVVWLVTRGRYVVVLAWIAAAVAATVYLPSLASADETGAEALVPGDTAALDAEARSLAHFDFPLLARAAVLQREPDGLSGEQQEAAFSQALAVAEETDDENAPAFALPISNEAGLFPASGENGTATLTYLFLPQGSLERQWRIAREYAAELDAAAGAPVGVTGASPARYEQWVGIRDALPIIGPATAALVALVFALAFRSLVAPLVVVAAAVVAYLIAVRLVAWSGSAVGVAAPREVQPIMIALLLGIVTDYAVFYLSGVRRRLAAGAEAREATADTAREYTPIIVTAGMIVTLGVLTLVAGRLDFFRAVGPGLALTVFVTLAVGLTLIPATIASLGHLTYWPRPLRAAEADLSLGARLLARFGSHRLGALVLAALSVAALLVVARPVSEMELAHTLIAGHRSGAETRRTAEAAAEAFAPGIVAPTEVLLEASGIDERSEELAELQRLLSNEPGVAGVVGPADQPPELGLRAFLAPDAARYALVLADEPLGADAIERLRELEERMPELLERAGLEDARASFAGDTAISSETVDLLGADFRRVALAALLVNFLLLAAFMRAVIAPLYLLAASALSLAAALGLTVTLFQNVLGYGELTYYVPFAVAVLSLSLGSDYNLFLAGRVWQEARHRPLREAIVYAAPRASRAIVIAGFTLAGSFALLAVIPVRPFRELAFAMAVGVLIDTFLVRPLLVPSLIALVGKASWWPGRIPTPAPAAEPLPGAGDSS